MKPEDNRNPEDIDKAARVAAYWWRQSLEGRRRSDIGDGIGNMMIALMHSSNEKKMPAPGKRDLDVFEDTLKEELVKQLTRCSQAWLDVDYGPEGMLAEVFRSSGAHGNFPCKTHMIVYAGDVTVRCGYQAPTERLLGNPIWSVELYNPNEEYSSGKRYRSAYHGIDEAKAKEIFAEELSKHPSIKVNADYNSKQHHLSLTRDGSYIDL